MNINLSVKIYDMKKNFIGRGILTDMRGANLRIYADELSSPVFGRKIYVEMYDELKGICQYLCRVYSISENQLGASIIKREIIHERRKSLKVRTDLSFYIKSLLRNNEIIADKTHNIKINIYNLSIGGMLISSGTELMVNDILEFNFAPPGYETVPLIAEIIRIDKAANPLTGNIKSVRYGCSFKKISLHDETAITKYLYDRQLQLHKQ